MAGRWAVNTATGLVLNRPLGPRFVYAESFSQRVRIPSGGLVVNYRNPPAFDGRMCRVKGARNGES